MVVEPRRVGADATRGSRHSAARSGPRVDVGNAAVRSDAYCDDGRCYGRRESPHADCGRRVPRQALPGRCLQYRRRCGHPAGRAYPRSRLDRCERSVHPTARLPRARSSGGYGCTVRPVECAARGCHRQGNTGPPRANGEACRSLAAPPLAARRSEPPTARRTLYSRVGVCRDVRRSVAVDAVPL